MKNRLKLLRKRLTSISQEEPLNKLSLATIILLDLFVLSLIFAGLNEHTQQLTTVNEYMPSQARNIFIEQAWLPDTRVAKLEALILAERNNYHYDYEGLFKERKLKIMHPASARLFRQISALSQDATIRELFLQRQKAVAEQTKIEEIFDKAKKSYDTQLLENIANASKSGASEIATTAQRHKQKLEMLSAEIAKVEERIQAQAGVQKLWQVTAPDEAVRARIIADYKRFQFWFPVKELGWQLIFLLPIFWLFYVWSVRSVRKDNPIQTLMASHLLVIATLPIIIKVIELVVEIIPKHFFKKIFELLQAMHLMALWHYFVILAVIGIGLLLVYCIQRKVFNQQQVVQKRLMKGACIVCNKKLPTNARFCPFCGRVQVMECSACKQATPIGGAFCVHCGRMH